MSTRTAPVATTAAHVWPAESAEALQPAPGAHRSTRPVGSLSDEPTLPLEWALVGGPAGVPGAMLGQAIKRLRRRR